MIHEGSLHGGHLVLLLFVLCGFGLLLLLFHHFDDVGLGVYGHLSTIGEFVGASLEGCSFAVLAQDADGSAGGELLGFGSNDPSIIEAGFGVEVLALLNYGTDGLLEFFNHGHGSSFQCGIYRVFIRLRAGGRAPRASCRAYTGPSR